MIWRDVWPESGYNPYVVPVLDIDNSSLQGVFTDQKKWIVKARFAGRGRSICIASDWRNQNDLSQKYEFPNGVGWLCPIWLQHIQHVLWLYLIIRSSLWTCFIQVAERKERENTPSWNIWILFPFSTCHGFCEYRTAFTRLATVLTLLGCGLWSKWWHSTYSVYYVYSDIYSMYWCFFGANAD